MNVEPCPHFSINVHPQTASKPEGLHCDFGNANGRNSKKQFDNFYNVKLATLEFDEGDFRDNLSPPTSPKFYAIKSHIRHFYYPPDEDDLESGEFMQGEDFQFTTEPKASTDWCSCIHLCLGINLLLLGAVSLVVSLLAYDSDADESGREMCQLVGLAALLCGIIVVVCSRLRDQSHSPPPPPSTASYYCVSLGCKGQPIPLYGTIGPIQPSFVLSQK